MKYHSFRESKQKQNIALFAMLFSIIFVVLLSVFGFTAKCEDINNSVLRLHIIANSDSDADQSLKLKVRDSILKENSSIFDDTECIENAKTEAKANLTQIRQTALNTIKNENYDYDVDVEFTNMYFTTRHYDSISLPAGYYDAVRVVIGEGKGKNWWCVMYPSLCLTASVDKDKLNSVLDDDEVTMVSNYGNYEIKFKFLEFFTALWG